MANVMRWVSVVALSWSFATGAGAAGGPEPALGELEQRFEDAYKAGDWAKALAAGEEMSAILQPKYITVLYNVAGMHCRLGHKEKAYTWLEWAIEAGFSDIQQLRTDDDFESIRQEERFRELARLAWAKGYISMLERDEREAFQKPEQVMAALALKPGERVADIGAGSGYFTIPVAKAVGPTGVVWAIDIHQPMLDYIAKRLKIEKLQNVQLRLVSKDDPQLPPGGVDTVLIIDTLHYIQDRTGYAKKVRAGLAAGGRVVVIDYIPKPFSERPWGPTPEQQISKETVDGDLAKAGLKPAKVHDFLTEQYFVEYRAE